MTRHKRLMSTVLISLIAIRTPHGKQETMPDFFDQITRTNFSAILKTYPGLTELRNEDLKLQGDGYPSYEVQGKERKLLRVNAILEVFPELTRKGMELSKFIARLKTHTWIKKENLDLIEALGGELPIRFVMGHTHAVIRFAKSPGQGIALYFRLAEEVNTPSDGIVNKDELFFYLQSEQPMDSGVQLRKFKVMEAALFIEVEVGSAG